MQLYNFYHGSKKGLTAKLLLSAVVNATLVAGAIEKLNEYIEYYNNERIITKLKTSPAKYQTCHQ